MFRVGSSLRSLWPFLRDLCGQKLCLDDGGKLLAAKYAEKSAENAKT